jgi:glutamate-1-semialdehyde 2,1-aminomutase
MTAKAGMEKAIEETNAQYFAKTPKSKELNEKAGKFLPGGDTRAATYFRPYPTYMVSGEGCYVYDADGNKYLDFLNNFTQQIHGHNHPKTMEAIRKQLEYGTILGAPHENQAKLAELLCQLIPSVEKIRFCNSGSEATMFAIKGARAYTGRDKIIKVEGIYHGTHDLVEASVFPPLSKAGDPNFPNVVPYNNGIAKNTFDNIVIVPFNNNGALKAAIKANKDELAALIIEPIMSAAGIIAATDDYLQYVREITSDEKIVLIFDEVVTLRTSPGGAQALYGVTPDMTAIGKFIGGGFPIGAFGGKEEIMALFSPPENVMAAGGRRVAHSGTFNGHPVIMSAGLATMEALTPDVYKKINSLGDLFRQRVNDEVFGALGIAAQAYGLGSLSYIHYTLDELNDYRDARRANEQSGQLPPLVHISLINNGIWIAERGEIALSTPMTEESVDEAVGAYKKTFEKLRPAIEQDLPHLIRN